MSNVKGIIGEVYDSGPQQGKFGTQHRVSITVNGERYGAFLKGPLSNTGAEVGRMVSFTYTEKGEYKNFDPKSLNVSKTAPVAQAAPAPAAQRSTGGTFGNVAGIKVGHAINNAVQLAIANKTTDLKSIHGLAIDIICLSVKLEGQFDKIVAKANNASPVAEAPAPAAAPAKPKAKPKAKPVVAPPPEPEYEEVEEQAEPDGPVEPEFNDDDIPF